MVRTEISQSSALRQKRGHTVADQKADSTETEAPVTLNNNGPDSQTDKNGLVYANGTAGDSGTVIDQLEELKHSSTENNVESFSGDSLSDVSKFES